jgi:hypothetical protein
MQRPLILPLGGHYNVDAHSLRWFRYFWFIIERGCKIGPKLLATIRMPQQGTRVGTRSGRKCHDHA